MTNPAPSRSFWPYGIIFFFVLAVIFRVLFVFWARHQNEDLVTENYYEAGVQHQQEIDQLDRTRPFAAQIAIAYDAAAQGISLSIPAAQAANATGTIQLYRPADARLDRAVPFTAGRDGKQFITAKDLSAGLWKVRVQWGETGKEFLVQRDVVIPGPH